MGVSLSVRVSRTLRNKNTYAADFSTYTNGVNHAFFKLRACVDLSDCLLLPVTRTPVVPSPSVTSGQLGPFRMAPTIDCMQASGGD